MLIHAGDVSGRGMESQIVDFMDWFTLQPHQHKIVIGGNHDFFFQQATPSAVKNVIPSNIIYLEDSGVEIGGIRIWGSPVSTFFYNWAFNLHPGHEMQQHWQKMPPGVDLLITHGPPKHIMDRTHSGIHVGCDELKKKVFEIKPRVHAFGHIHEGYGSEIHNGTQFINASVLNAAYQLTNEPVIFNW